MSQKFLAIRLSSIGDIVHALPAVCALAETYPGAEITWAIEKRYAVLLNDNPYVPRVIPIDTMGWRKRLFSAETLREAAAAIHSLREQRYDAIIDFQGLIKTGIIARLSRSSRRIGYAPSRHREPGAGLFYTEEAPLWNGMHAIEENLALVERLGALASSWKFPLPRRDKDEQGVDTRLGAMGVRDVMIVNPGGGWMAKRWPPRNYALLIRQMATLKKTGTGIVLTGSPADEPDITEILRQTLAAGAHYLPTDLTQYISLARRARLFVGGDTGPMHLAAALGVPIVAIMGPTDPRRNGPFSVSDIVVSNHEPINHSRRQKTSGYMEGISVNEVYTAVRRRLEIDER